MRMEINMSYQWGVGVRKRSNCKSTQYDGLEFTTCVKVPRFYKAYNFDCKSMWMYYKIDVRVILGSIDGYLDNIDLC